MNEYESARRDFLSKLGLTIGATLLATSKLSATIIDDKDILSITPEQQQFMNRYERWMDEFIPVIKTHRENQFDIYSKKRIVELSDQAKEWQVQLQQYMKDENFARYYMAATERMTKEIY